MKASQGWFSYRNHRGPDEYGHFSPMCVHAYNVSPDGLVRGQGDLIHPAERFSDTQTILNHQETRTRIYCHVYDRTKPRHVSVLP